jgi:hypothetical protein
MKIKFVATVLATLWLVASCKDDADITSSIHGKWQGTLAEVQVKPFGLPVPISRDVPSFTTEMEFTADGTMIVWDDGHPITGTYVLTGDELTADIAYNIEDVDLSGTYTIETLTETSLVFTLRKRNVVIADPAGGPNITGQITITLHFQRL